ncbi:MDR family MFS transporter [Alkalihalobacillus pseudalcaliphilus]|uniref:MDR family MFS transporter n=1 Tax=Alkalihalobacillus pseudalcaliphilus TaxID=79884 RepID=UPI00064DE32B|nr:MFS transporter [Alkalihalobacillus pseudalcaliphilus]KMK77784.1 multidrug MFS transporter [Alkalihalobacillus pseudalcaliphilus]
MPKSLWFLLIAVAIQITGASFLWPLNSLIIHQELGKSLTAAGFILFLHSGAGVLGNMTGGRLFDKIGAYRTILLGLSFAVVSTIALIFAHTSVIGYTICLMGIGFGAGATFPAMYAFAGSIWPDGGRKPFNAMYVAQNLGIAIGTASIGFITQTELTTVFYANALVYIFVLLFVAVTFKRINTGQEVGATVSIESETVKKLSKHVYYSLALVLSSFFICWLVYTQWQANVSVHSQNLGLTLQQYSMFWTINGLLIVLAQPILSIFIKKWVTSLRRQMVVGISLFFVSYAVLSQAELFSAFMIAMVILTVGEMFFWPVVPTIAHKLAPKGKEGSFQGLVNSVSTSAKMIGPLFGGFLVDMYSFQIMIYVLLVFIIVAIVTAAIYEKPLQNENRQKITTNPKNSTYDA